jgi:hypothetical protein
MFYTGPGFLAVVDSNSTHRVYRVPGFLYSRRNWIPPPQPFIRKRVLLPLFGSREETLTGGREGVGDPTPTKGQTLWYSGMFTTIPLRFESSRTPNLPSLISNLSIFLSLHVCRRSRFTDGRRGWEWILLGAHKPRARRTVCKSVFFSKDINC